MKSRIEHEISMELCDNGVVVHALYVDGTLVGKYPRMVPPDFYDVIQRTLLICEIAKDIKLILNKYCI